MGIRHLRDFSESRNAGKALRRLRSGVNHPRCTRRVLCPRLNQAPTQEREIASRFLRILPHDGNGLSRSDIETRGPVLDIRGHRRSIPLQAASSATIDTVRTLGDYGRSDSVTIMGVWSEGFSCPRGPLSISQLSSRSASVGDNKK
jgi:hypothetical protein